jgi:hypothetical protein
MRVMWYCCDCSGMRSTVVIQSRSSQGAAGMMILLMRSVFTGPVTVGCDARYTDAGPGRLHLNACVCGRIESIAGRMSGDRGMREGNER